MTHAASPVWRVLVVDDEENLNWSLLTSLRKDGYQADGALTGEEAQRRLRTEHYDCVISDVKMPGMDGFELLQWLRRHHPQTRIIMMTAFGSPTARQEAMQNGVIAYLEKPFDLRTLKEHLRRLATTQQTPATDGYDLIEVARVLNLSRRDIAVQVTGADIAGALLFQRGELVWAEAGDKQGEDAFYALCAGKVTRIEPTAWEGFSRRNITESMSRLLFLALAQREARSSGHISAPEPVAEPARATPAEADAVPSSETYIMPAVQRTAIASGPLNALKDLVEQLAAPCCALLIRPDGTVAARQARGLPEFPAGVYVHLAAAAQAASRGVLLADLGTVQDMHIRTSQHSVLLSRLPGAEGAGMLALILPLHADPAAVIPAIRSFMPLAAEALR